LSIITIIVLFPLDLYTQNAGIGDSTDFTPDPSSILELRSTSRGLLLPRMSFWQRTHITSPAPGLLVIQTDDGTGGESRGIWYLNPIDSQWHLINSSASTVTSVGLSLPAEFFVSTPLVTTTGTLTASWTTQLANTVFASPTGSTGYPTFRKLVPADIPILDISQITTGILPIANGGTGQSNIPLYNLIYGNGTSPVSTLSPSLTTGTLLMNTNGAAPIWTTLNLLPSTSGILPVANGGTGSSSSPPSGTIPYGNGNSLGYSGVGSVGQVLTSNGTGTPYWTMPTTGTVNSIGLTVPSILNVTPSSISNSGTFAVTLAIQSLNSVFASPSDGSSGTPLFRSLVAADIPSLNWSKITNTPTNLAGYGITDALSGNGAITAGTNTKISYDSKGLVTSGTAAQLASADFAGQGTTTTILHGSASGNPSFSQIGNDDIAVGTIDLTSKLRIFYPLQMVEQELTCPNSRWDCLW